MAPSDQFFAASAMAGHLHLRDIGDYGTWDPTRIDFSEEWYVDVVLRRIQALKIQTVEELDEVLVASRDKAGSIDLYVHEGLLNETRRRWEESGSSSGSNIKGEDVCW